MKKVCVLFLFALLLIGMFTFISSVNSQASQNENQPLRSGSWVQKAPMPTPRSNLGVAVVDGKIYAIGGTTNSALLGLNKNEEYDPTTNTWTTKAPIPTARYEFSIATCQGKIYCIGGLTNFNSSDLATNEAYDPATNTWTAKAAMPTAASKLQANVANGKIYLMGYIGGLHGQNINIVYDPSTDSWTTKTPIPFGGDFTVATAASTALDDKIYSFGGTFSPTTGNIPLTRIYNPATDTWSAGNGPSTYFIFDSIATATSGTMAPERIYVFYHPYFSSKTFDGIQIYDPTTDSWSADTNMPTDRYGFGVAVVNDVFYLIGGDIITGYHTEMTSAFGMPLLETVGLNAQYTPPGYGTVPPAVSVISPENNQTYTAGNVTLNFTVTSQISQITHLTYSIDQNGSITTGGNVTLTGLSNGNHTLTIAATDTNGNTGISRTINFTISEPPTPAKTSTANNSTINQTEAYLIATAAVVLVVAMILAAVLLTRRRQTGPK